jgi:ArsR family transcriptional regulator
MNGSGIHLDSLANWPYTDSREVAAARRSREETDMKRADFRSQARVMKALANEARLMIVDRLADGECSAGDLTRLVGLDQSTVSKHLAVLRAQGIVEDRRAGSVVFYRLAMPCVVNFFSCAAQAVRERK